MADVIAVTDSSGNVAYKTAVGFDTSFGFTVGTTFVMGLMLGLLGMWYLKKHNKI